MCGRFTLRANLNRILEEFALESAVDLSPRFNIAPSQPIPAIRATEGQRRLDTLHWGLVPFWADDTKIGNRMINARSETAADKPAFRAAFRRRRCLIVADGFYEWKKQGSNKQPFFIHFDDDRPFAFAGLWESWDGPKDEKRDEPLESCTILTTEPNELMGSLHDRMPVILPDDRFDLWLDPEFQEKEELRKMLVPFPDDEMKAVPVSKFVNNPRNDAPECIEPQGE